MLSPVVVGLTALTSLATPLILPSQLIFAVPLAASIINLQWMYDEYYYLRSWAISQGTNSPTTDRMLGTWYTAWRDSYGPLPSVVGLPMMWSASARFLYLNRASGLNAITTSYAIGFALAIAHMPAGGKAFPLLTTIAEGKDGAMRALETWLGMHVKRLWTVDVPAVAAFAYGFYLVLS